MIELFEQPKTITLREALEEMRKNCNFKYIQKFEYGDSDNVVRAVIDSFDISLRYTYKVETHITLGECYELSLKTPFKYLSDVKTDGYVKNLEDILDKEITVIGVYKDE